MEIHTNSHIPTVFNYRSLGLTSYAKRIHAVFPSFNSRDHKLLLFFLTCISAKGSNFIYGKAASIFSTNGKIAIIKIKQCHFPIMTSNQNKIETIAVEALKYEVW